MSGEKALDIQQEYVAADLDQQLCGTAWSMFSK
jgi:hypothetical protein